jgi:hypothetical protein
MTDTLGEIIADYRRSPLCDLGGEAMARFLEAVADVLRSKVLYYSISHSRLGLSKFGAYPERQEHPYVGVETDGRVFYLNYYEGWKDKEFHRSRTDNISCTIEHARAALLELLARLKPAEAEPVPSPDPAGT